MKPIQFPQANKVLRAPEGMEEECGDLYVYNDGEESVSIWQLSEEELLMIAKTGKLLLGVLAGSSQPPVRLAVYAEPEEEKSQKPPYKGVHFVAGSAGGIKMEPDYQPGDDND